MSILTENWHTWYIGGVDSESRLRFLKVRPQNPFLSKFGPKIQSCPLCMKIGAHNISRMLITNPDLDLWNFDPKIYFWANLDRKNRSLAENSHTECLDNFDSYSDITFPSFETKSFFGQIWAEKFKIVYFHWKLAYMVYWWCWFLFRQ